MLTAWQNAYDNRGSPLKRSITQRNGDISVTKVREAAHEVHILQGAEELIVSFYSRTAHDGEGGATAGGGAAYHSWSC